jgi:hypothetical protein
MDIFTYNKVKWVLDANPYENYLFSISIRGYLDPYPHLIKF